MHLTPLLLTNCLQKDLQENRLPQESGNPNRQYYDRCDDVQSNTALFLKLVFQIPIFRAVWQLSPVPLFPAIYRCSRRTFLHTNEFRYRV